MAKVIQFPVSAPEKFGYKPVVRKKKNAGSSVGQLNLFTGGKIVSLSQLTTFEEALALDELGDPEAKLLYQRAIKEGNNLADAYCNWGIIESGQHQITKAIDCFTKSLKEDPRHFESHYNLANLYAEVGNLALAKVHYQLVVEIEPEFPNSYFNLALTLALNKELPEAIERLEQYRKLVNEDERKIAEELMDNLSRGIR